MKNDHLVAALRRRKPATRVRFASAYAGDVQRPGTALVPLLPAQRYAVDEMIRTRDAGDGPWGPRGVLGFVGCGHGKTLICGLAPHIYRARRPLLLVPASVKQATIKALQQWDATFYIDKSTVISYEALSSPSGKSAVEKYGPDLLICDEAHYLADAGSARSRRLFRYIADNRHCRCMFVSGTMIDRSLYSWAHMAHASLRDWSPLPSDPGELRHYANVLDHDTTPTADDYGWLRELYGGGTTTRELIKQKFHELLTTTPGVVFSAGVSANVSIVFKTTAGPVAPPAVVEARNTLDKLWALPDGTEIVDALEHHRHERTLRFGFFTRWDFPSSDAGLYDAFFVARRAWSALVRVALDRGDGDSPGEIAERAEAGQLPYVARAWAAWIAGRDNPPPRVVEWLPGAKDYLVSLLPQRTDPVVVWYENRAVGEALAQVGWPVHDAGSAPPRFPSAAAVSWRVHSKGWNAQGANGQEYHRQVVLQAPSDPKTWEQMLSRMHRHGQQNDVETDIVLTTTGARRELDKVLHAARHVATLSGEPQRLLIGQWV